MIEGYNNNTSTSKKRLIDDRQQFLDSFWKNTIEESTKKKLALYNIIFRLSNSSDEKYLGFFKELCATLVSLGVNEPNHEKKRLILTEIHQIYERAALSEDPFLDFTHNFEKTYSVLYKINLQNAALKTMFRLMEDINAQKQKIFNSGIKDSDSGETFFEYADEYQYKNPLTIENLEREIIVEDFYEPKEVKKPKEKQKKKEGFVDIDVDKVEDLQNYFLEFMEKYEGMVKSSREYWQMNVTEILRDLNSEKKDHELLEGLISQLFNDDFKKDRAAAMAQEAAEFLLKHRNEIKVMCKIKRVFEKEEEKENKTKKEKHEFNKPSNFKVTTAKNGGDENYMMEMGNEDAMLVDNYQILSKILVNFLFLSIFF